MATDIEILARQITNQVLTIDAGAGYTIGDLTNNDASGSIYQSWYNICTPLVPWINTHGSGSTGSGSVIWGNIFGSINNQLDLIALLNTKQNSLGYTPENISNKSTSTTLGTSNTLYPSQNAVKVYVDNNISASSSVTTASNLGTGLGVYDQKVGNDLQFKSLIAGNNITLSSSSTEITINSTASGSTSGSVTGLPFGGDIGQVITKSGVADYIADWEYPPGMLIHGYKTDLMVNGSESINTYFNVNLSTSSVFSLTGLSTKNPYSFLINNISSSSILIKYPQEYVVDLAPADNFSVSSGSSREAIVIYDGLKRIWRIGNELREVTKSTEIPLYIGGNFTSPSSYFTVIDKTTKIASSAGWPTFNGAVNVITQDSNTAYIGGQFSTSPSSYFTVIDKTTKATGSGWPSFNADVYNILQDSSYLYMGGNFTLPSPYFTVIDKTTKATGSGWPSFNASISSIDQDASYLYIGGSFTSPATRFTVINKLTKEIDSGWPSFSYTVSRVKVDDTYIYLATYVPASGNFFFVINKLTKQIDSSWPVFTSSVTALYSTSNYLYVGGQFTDCFVVINKSTKTLESGWPVFNNQVSTILVDTDNVYVGGVFTSPDMRFTVIDKTTKATGSGWPSFSGGSNNVMFIG